MTYAAIPKRASNQPSAVNLIAAQIVGAATEPDDETNKEKVQEKNPAAVALGRLGGKKGGPARATKLSAKKRKEIAQKAARKRWGKDE